MRIALILDDEVAIFPPARGLLAALLDLGHDVTLVSYGAELIADEFRAKHQEIDAYEIGAQRLRAKDGRAARAAQLLRDRRKLQHFIESSKTRYDLIWVLTVSAARELGKSLYGTRYVLNISELQDRANSVFNGILPFDMPVIFDSGKVKRLARDAARVVVPEYNRAYMQQVLWNLETTPHILPNRQVPPKTFDTSPEAVKIHQLMERDERKILLYQGIIATDRDLEPYVEAIDYLNGEYAIYLFGRFTNQNQDVLDKLIRDRDDVIYCGFFPAPNHLQFTARGWIGLLPYKPTKAGRHHPFNALYCAPNKIWEYAYYGLPMLGSDVPGLTLPFEKWDMGLTAPSGNSKRIAECVLEIDARHGEMAANARAYFDNFDFTGEVECIIEEAMAARI